MEAQFLLLDRSLIDRVAPLKPLNSISYRLVVLVYLLRKVRQRIFEWFAFLQLLKVVNLARDNRFSFLSLELDLDSILHRRHNMALGEVLRCCARCEFANDKRHEMEGKGTSAFGVSKAFVDLWRDAWSIDLDKGRFAVRIGTWIGQWL